MYDIFYKLYNLLHISQNVSYTQNKKIKRKNFETKQKLERKKKHLNLISYYQEYLLIIRYC